ncbi:T9SS type A sorting domain-containing protein [Hymenobacter negativus]|uniref:T9SS type A sorting domain-containing protein n=1 Tax=Hymenobacter negativus TaxID=2795026 RepID=A0ABS0Q8N0_9BACT|nr:T9SS type A sorting domain-containing protein [Hymenobacter negativus]MBH8559034.1 T9SS type A sorting domain-containing protein [Hymenobacter negativus]
MMTRFHTLSRLLLPALLLSAGTAAAQLSPSEPLSADPGRAAFAPTAASRAQLRGTAALTLPFFDDFTTPLNGAPNPLKWMPTGGAFVSNRLAIQPLTRGAATLDGLRANGQSYSGQVNSVYGPIDSLVSQPIGLGGLTANDKVALSFAWQAGSIVSAPNSNGSTTPVRLELFVKTDANAWEQVWVYNAQRVRTGFRQQVVLLNQAKYLHGNFQFMFVASGNNSDNHDNWSVDYVLLDRGRTAGLADTTFQDSGAGGGLTGGNPSGGMRSPLRRFASMPVWQFNAATPPSSELAASLGVNYSNLRSSLAPLNVNVLGTVQQLPAGPVIGTWLQRSLPLSTLPRLTPVTGAASAVAPPATPDAKRLRYTMALNSQEQNPLTLPNDTIYRDVELANYYAYDDGTAESFTNLLPYPTGQQSAFAYRFDLNQPDYVRGLRLYPVYPGSTAAAGNRTFDFDARPVTISVWGDLNGRPDPTPRASKTATIPAAANIPAGWQYYQIDFDQPVPVSGIFYVGFSQPSTSAGRILPYGLDLNSSFPAQHLVRRDNAGVWDTTNFASGRGALMMRPVMTNNVATATTAGRAAAAYSLYPNPAGHAHGTVSIAGPGFERAALLDAMGRVVWEQPAAQAGNTTLPLPALPAGLYTVRLTLADGRTIGRKLVLE